MIKHVNVRLQARKYWIFFYNIDFPTLGWTVTEREVKRKRKRKIWKVYREAN